jgi:microcystin-dependent protein
VGTPFLAELRLMSFSYAPVGWATCSGQSLPINQNQALFSLLGTRYGGNGVTTFQLPDLRERVPMHMGSGHDQGERGGEATHTLTLSEMPAHTHVLSASGSDGNTQLPSGNVLARTVNNIYAGVSNLTTLNVQTVASVGGSQPHENQQPYLKMNWCIALQGIFPSQN